MSLERGAWKQMMLLAGLLALLASACRVSAPGGELQRQSGQAPPAFQFFARQAPTPTPFQPSPPTPTPAPTATPAGPRLLRVWSPTELPADLLAVINLPPGYEGISVAPDPNQAEASIELAGSDPDIRWIYALAAPFPTLVQGVSAQEIHQAWIGQAQGIFAGRPLLVGQDTLGALTILWGPPAEGAVQSIAAGGAELLAYAWEHRPSYAIIPFSEIEPRWKVLEVDGQSPLRKNFDPAAYALTLPLSLQPGPALTMHGGWPFSEQPLTNRQPERLTTLAMTGVTALVRATAYTMEQRGITYPAKDIGEWLREADITHISNEVPFAQNCPYPNPSQEGLRFCSDTRYIQLLEESGADVIELTGDHFQDWGTDAMLYTLELYQERGWKYYGGGADLQEGKQAAIIEHHGNRLAFIGCNGKGLAPAGPNRPGAAPCSGDWLPGAIQALAAQGYLPIATFQHYEYYTYRAQPNQERDFRAAAQAGAVIVSGSQAHQPQSIEFLGSSFIHYGLGNLYFDQYDISLATRQGFIDRHIFYGGRYLGVELLPIMFVDYARPRPMNESERQDLLRAVFNASGW